MIKPPAGQEADPAAEAPPGRSQARPGGPVALATPLPPHVTLAGHAPRSCCYGDGRSLAFLPPPSPASPFMLALLRLPPPHVTRVRRALPCGASAAASGLRVGRSGAWWGRERVCVCEGAREGGGEGGGGRRGGG